MNCPYCNCEMQKGYMLSPYALAAWYAEGEKPKWNPRKSGIRLSNNSALKAQRIESYHCGNCKKIIINLPGQEVTRI